MSEAMCQASLDTIRRVFDRGGNIEQGQLLHNAVQRAAPDAVELIHMLLDKGAPINGIHYKDHAQSWRDRCYFGLGTPLHYAAQDGRVELVSILLSEEQILQFWIQREEQCLNQQNTIVNQM